MTVHVARARTSHENYDAESAALREFMAHLGQEGCSGFDAMSLDVNATDFELEPALE